MPESDSILMFPHSPHAAFVKAIPLGSTFEFDEDLFVGTSLEGLAIESHATSTGAYSVRGASSDRQHSYLALTLHMGYGTNQNTGETAYITFMNGLSRIHLLDSALLIASNRDEQLEATPFTNLSGSDRDFAVAAIRYRDIISIDTIRKERKLRGGFRVDKIIVHGPGGALAIDTKIYKMPEPPEPASIVDLEQELVRRAVTTKLQVATDPAERLRLEGLANGSRTTSNGDLEALIIPDSEDEPTHESDPQPVESTDPYCSDCGHQFIESNKFCRKCGAKRSP